MIEWFLQPKNDTERSISHAMKLYSANTLVDDMFERYLDKDDKKIDRKLKELQSRKLAREEGLDYESYMSDDAMDGSRALKGAIAYGASPSAPPRVSSFVRKAPVVAHDAQWIASLDRGPKAMAHNVGELMRKFEAGKLGQKLTKASKYASFL